MKKDKPKNPKHITMVKDEDVARIFDKGYVEYQHKSGAISAQWVGKTQADAKKELLSKGWKVIAENKAPKIKIKREIPVNSSSLKFVKNLDIGNNRTLRMEVIGGDVTEEESMFMTGTLHFIGGTLGRKDNNHVAYVSYLMTKMTRHLVDRIEKGDNSLPDDMIQGPAED